jgi:DNA-binding transcriptional regulator GbsR (MarR family)
MAKATYRVEMKSVNGSAVAAGHKAKAVSTVTTSPADRKHLRKAITETERLIELLDERQQALAGGEELSASAAKVKKKLSEKRPKLKAVRGLLEQLAEGVAGVGVLTECVARIQELISHLSF